MPSSFKNIMKYRELENYNSLNKNDSKKLDFKKLSDKLGGYSSVILFVKMTLFQNAPI